MKRADRKGVGPERDDETIPGEVEQRKSPWPTSSTALFVLAQGGAIFGSYPPGCVEEAEMTARAIGGLIVGVPVLADYRDGLDR